MRRYLGWSSFFFLGWAWLVLAASPIDIQLPHKATVAGPAITLGEIAEVNGDNRAELEKVRRVKLSAAAPAGGTIKLTQGFVKVALRKEGYSLEALSFSGADVVEVLTQSQLFSLAGLLPDIKSFVLGQLKESPENVDIKISGADKKISLPAGSVKANFRPPLSGKFDGAFLLTTELEVDGRMVRVLPLRVTVEVFHPVVVTTHRVEKGSKFSRENVSLVRTSTSKVLGQYMDRLENVLGRTAAAPLVPGTVVRINSLFDPPVVKRGQSIQAIVQYGNVEITVQVRATEDGKAGDVIRVENSETHKLLRGKVLDEKTVVVNHEGS